MRRKTRGARRYLLALLQGRVCLRCLTPMDQRFIYSRRGWCWRCSALTTRQARDNGPKRVMR